MKAPDKIYIHRKDNPLEITWSEIKEKNATNVEYIRKDAMLEWLNERLRNSGRDGLIHMIDVIDKLNSL